MRIPVFALFAGLATLPLAASAHADVRITTEVASPDGRARQTSMVLAGHKAKVDMGEMAVIVDTDTGKMMTLMKAQKAYMEVDMGAMQSRIAGAMSMMKQRLQSMPPAQRQQIEAMLAKRGLAPGRMGAAPAAPTYESTGATQKVGAWSCRVYHMTRNGTLVADLCIAPFEEVGLSAADMAAFRALSAAMAKSIPGGGGATPDLEAQTKQIGFVGMPIKSTIFAEGKAQVSSTVTAVDHPDLAADAFAVPPDYVRKTLPGFGGAAP